MAQAAAETLTPQQHIKNLEKYAVDGDVAGMAQSIGELHTQWGDLSEPMKSDVLKLEAIFLSLLQSRTRKV